MRIGIDARSITEAQPSGISTYAVAVIQAMAQAAPDTEFVLFVSGRKLGQTVLLKQLQQQSNISWRHIQLPNKLFHGASVLQLMPAIEHWLGAIDVMFAPNWHILPLAQHTPLVVTVHDTSYQLYPQFLSWRRRAWHWAVQPQHLLQRANEIIAVSHSTRQAVLQQYHLSPRHVHTIYSGVPTLPAAAPISVTLPLHYCAALSTLEPRKNTLALVQAFIYFKQRHPTSQLALVLMGQQGWKSRQLLRTITGQRDIYYLGYVTPAQKTYVLKQASWFMYPSIYEGFGFPPLEALQLNCPVIASWAGAIPEILGQAAYYIDPYSITSIAHAITTFEYDPAIRSQLLAAAPAVLARYHWQRTAKATLAVLQQAVYNTPHAHRH
ncbi:MAG: glycosyltransferase family 4 protein [Candidatus Kerfeldbacteria bacterium]|nr:glycosyltransferase family 4 protein [Candidatus Kerfeldbacteria bacterium]